MMTTARWITDLACHLRRGRHVVLHGNVRDLAMFNGQLVPFDMALDAALAEVGYTLRAQWNQIDGIEFAEDDMAARWQAIERAETPTPVRQGRAYAPPTRQGVAPPAATPSPPVRRHVDPAPAFAAFRRVLATDGEQISAVIDLADRVFSEHQPHAERSVMVTLQAAMQSAWRHVSSASAAPRNAVVLIAAMLGQVPAWLYREHPLVQVIQVGRPERSERDAFLRRQWTEFRGARGATPTDIVADEFAALTDGMAYWDLEALRLASHHEEIGVNDLPKLLDVFRHGARDDPWEQLSAETLGDARAQLARQVIGQDAAIDAVLDVLTVARGGISVDGASRSTRPKGVLFFVGPTGVGKTELAKAVTRLIFGDPTAFARFDMSEYAQEHAAERLTGAPPSYVGFEAGGQLTNRMKQRPFSVVLFDEIEKAHPRILDRFLQVLDDGRLTDGLGDTAFFSQALLIFTSNIGSTRRERGADGQEHERSAIEPALDYPALASHFRHAVRDHFIQIGRPELLGRIGEERIVAFDRLREHHIDAILGKFLNGIAESALDRHGVEVRFHASIHALAHRECTRPAVIALGGRGIRNFVQSRLVAPVNRAVLTSSAQAIEVFAENDQVDVREWRRT